MGHEKGQNWQSSSPSSGFCVKRMGVQKAILWERRELHEAVCIQFPPIAFSLRNPPHVFWGLYNCCPLCQRKMCVASASSKSRPKSKNDSGMGSLMQQGRKATISTRKYAQYSHHFTSTNDWLKLIESSIVRLLNTGRWPPHQPTRPLA